MKISVDLKNIEPTMIINERLNEKSQEIGSIAGKVQIKWICYISEGLHHVDIHVTGEHFTFYASATNESLFEAIHMSADKVMRQILREKKIRANAIKHSTEFIPKDESMEFIFSDSIQESA